MRLISFLPSLKELRVIVYWEMLSGEQTRCGLPPSTLQTFVVNIWEDMDEDITPRIWAFGIPWAKNLSVRTCGGLTRYVDELYIIGPQLLKLSLEGNKWANDGIVMHTLAEIAPNLNELSVDTWSSELPAPLEEPFPHLRRLYVAMKAVDNLQLSLQNGMFPVLEDLSIDCATHFDIPGIEEWCGSQGVTYRLRN